MEKVLKSVWDFCFGFLLEVKCRLSLEFHLKQVANQIEAGVFTVYSQYYSLRE